MCLRLVDLKSETFRLRLNIISAFDSTTNLSLAAVRFANYAYLIKISAYTHPLDVYISRLLSSAPR